MALGTAAAAGLDFPPLFWLVTGFLALILGAMAVVEALRGWGPTAPAFKYFGLTTYSRPVPVIVADAPVPGGHAWVTSIMSMSPPESNRHPHLMFVAIPFSNVSESGDPSAVMGDVSGTVRLLDAEGEELDRSYGRWREIAKPSLNPSERAPEGMEAPAGRVTLAPDGQPHLFDVVAWEPWGPKRDRCALVRDPLSGMFMPRGRAEMPVWLTEGDFRLEVTLRGTNVDGGVRFHYELTVEPTSDDYPEDRSTPGPTLVPVTEWA